MDEFLLPDLWQLHLYGYEADLTVDGTAHMHPARQGQPRSAWDGGSLSLPGSLRASLRRTCAWSQPERPAASRSSRTRGRNSRLLKRSLRQALAAWPNTAAWASAEVWAALWRVTQLAPPATQNTQAAHPAVTAAMALIEARLASRCPCPRSRRRRAFRTTT